MNVFLVSGRGLAYQQEISLVLAKTPPIHYKTMMDSVFNAREHRARDASVRKQNLCM